MFDYKTAVKADVKEWLNESIYDWSVHATPADWVREIVDFKCSLLENVCGSCDGTLIRYTGSHSATETEIVASLPEISNIVTEFFEPDEFAEMVKDEGIYAFDYVARRHALTEYLGSGEFLQEVEERMNDYRETEFDNRRSKLIQLTEHGMMTVDEALSQYEVMLLTYGKLK